MPPARAVLTPTFIYTQRHMKCTEKKSFTKGAPLLTGCLKTNPTPAQQPVSWVERGGTGSEELTPTPLFLLGCRVQLSREGENLKAPQR